MTPSQDGMSAADSARAPGGPGVDGTPPLNSALDRALDPAKPAPNDGRVGPADAPKLWYAIERILLPPDWRTVGPAPWFRADRRLLQGQPGFHIIGICPRCRHQTTSVCATEYLADDVDITAGSGRQAAAEVAVRPAAAEVAVRPAAAKVAAGEPIAARSETAAGADDSTGQREHERRGRRRLQAENQPSLRWRKPGGIPAPGGAKTQVTVLRCACVENHVPATPGAFGCGAEWLLQVEYDDSSRPGQTYISIVDPEKAYRYWPAADAAAAEVPAALTTARGAAKSWAGALTAILGLIGIGTLLGSRATLQSFSPLAEVLFGILALIAVLADGVMLYQSDLATFGWPRIRAALKPSDQWNADLDPLTQASASVRKLHRSVWAAVISAVAALGAVGILLFTPPAPVPSSKATVTYVVNGVKTVTPCGTVTFPGASDVPFLTFTPDGRNGKPVRINLTMIAKIGAC